MPAPLGNQNALKFRTRKERRAVCRELVAHLEQGFTLDAFPLLSRPALRDYIEKYPEDFPPEELQRALRVARKKDEAVGLAASSGQYLTGFDPSRFNVAAWIFRMKNRYGWGLNPKDSELSRMEEETVGLMGEEDNRLEVVLTVIEPGQPPRPLYADDPDSPPQLTTRPDDLDPPAP